tara:strand:+ start:48688 stop:49434 length:747 start_codon:yes stop_codon:yes gene_type:complete
MTPISKIVLIACMLILPMGTDEHLFGPSTLSAPQKGMDHGAWDKLLKKHVAANGKVDYKGFVKDKKLLDAYLEHLGKNPASEYGTKDGRLAYYINLYNAATVKLIVDHYPVKSIKDIKNPWGREFVKVGNRTISLGELEHGILRKMEEPRIHFAINCASTSCPDLLNEAFVSAKMGQQLEKATKRFVNDSTKNKITAGSYELSALFKWYKKDFTTQGSLREFINLYGEHPITKEQKCSYLPYDWSLNE